MTTATSSGAIAHLASASERLHEWNVGAVERHPWFGWIEVGLLFLAFGLVDGALGGEVIP